MMLARPLRSGPAWKEAWADEKDGCADDHDEEDDEDEHWP